MAQHSDAGEERAQRADQSIFEVIAEAGRRLGFAPHPGPPVRRCAGGCDAVVELRGDMCPSCVERDAAERRRLALKRAWSTLPTWPHATFENGALAQIVEPRILEAALAWKSTGSLALLGPTGRGKSTAARAICERILTRADKGEFKGEDFARAAKVRWTKARDLADAARRHKLGDGRSPEEREARAASILVIDELGFEVLVDDVIPRLLDHRYDKALPTIVTSGRKVAALAERYGEATVRRFTERATVVEAWR